MPSVSLSLPSTLAGRTRTWVCLSCMFWVRIQVSQTNPSHRHSLVSSQIIKPSLFGVFVSKPFTFWMTATCSYHLHPFLISDQFQTFSWSVLFKDLALMLTGIPIQHPQIRKLPQLSFWKRGLTIKQATPNYLHGPASIVLLHHLALIRSTAFRRLTPACSCIGSTRPWHYSYFWSLLYNLICCLLLLLSGTEPACQAPAAFHAASVSTQQIVQKKKRSEKSQTCLLKALWGHLKLAPLLMKGKA